MTLRLPVAAVSVALGIGLSVSSGYAGPHARPAADDPALPAADTLLATATRSRVPLAAVVRVEDRAFGHSGTLRVAVVGVMDKMEAAFVRSDADSHGVTYRWDPLYGTPPKSLGGQVRLESGLRAPSQPGFWRLVLSRDGEEHEVGDLMVVTQVPFQEKRGGRLNGYLIGTYPTEGSGRTDEYAPPAGFIEVTPENKDVLISRHLRLGQFLTKDQFNVWPKYVALDLRLIDKLEMVVKELHAMGVRAERVHIMSGFRTPNYNGPGEGGRARLSRHTYGDAADIWIENGARTGYIADLNGDGMQDTRDADVILQAVERVEQQYADLIGGVGVYRDNGPRGPFVHVDVRGGRSRW